MNTIADAAKEYAARGWKPVPVNRKTKRATGKAWQKRAYEPAQFDANSQNVSIQFGDVSGGLCDVDLDTMDAVGLAPEFLPQTGAIFGRRSKPCSHQLYFSDLHKTETKAVIKYCEYSGGKAGQTIVELRIGADSKGAVTVFPPSMHVTGELVQWDGLQWILMRQRTRHGVPFWNPVSFVRSTRSVLERCMRERGVEPCTAAKLLVGLPYTYDAWKTSQSTPVAPFLPV